MIFAAGLGTRLKPITDHTPKAMVNVGGKPLIRHVIEKLKDAGTERIIVNAHHLASQIREYLSDNNYFDTDIRISDETEMLLDTGGGIKKAAPLFDQHSPILIHNVDILSNVDLKRFYAMAAEPEKDGDKNMPPTEALLLVSRRKTKRYLLFDNDMQLVGWTNIETGEIRSPYAALKPEECKMFAFSGIHTISPSLTRLMDEEFPEKFGIIDFYLKACRNHRIKGYFKQDLKLLDVGKPETLKQAETFLDSRQQDTTTNKPKNLI